MDLVKFLYFFIKNNKDVLYKDIFLSHYSKEEFKSLVKEAVHLNLINVDIGEGFMGGIESYQITLKGKTYSNNYCPTCECIPCDCDWGN